MSLAGLVNLMSVSVENPWHLTDIFTSQVTDIFTSLWANVGHYWHFTDTFLTLTRYDTCDTQNTAVFNIVLVEYFACMSCQRTCQQHVGATIRAKLISVWQTLHWWGEEKLDTSWVKKLSNPEFFSPVFWMTRESYKTGPTSTSLV
jgi:hypothetical protein